MATVSIHCAEFLIVQWSALAPLGPRNRLVGRLSFLLLSVIANLEKKTLITDAPWFSSTHWSVVLAAGREPTPASEAALEKLCRTYWPSIFTYALRLGHAESDAKDLTQAFFQHFLEKRYIRAADPQRGRFRGFLRMSFKHFTQGEWAKAQAQKRGGGATFVPWEDFWQYRPEELSHPDPPDLCYDRQWALRLFAQVMSRLRTEYDAAGKAHQYHVLKPFLERSGDEATHAEAAAQLGSTVNAVVVAIHRLRLRLRELVRDEVAQTVASPADIDDELRHLRRLIVE